MTTDLFIYWRPLDCYLHERREVLDYGVARWQGRLPCFCGGHRQGTAQVFQGLVHKQQLLVLQPLQLGRHRHILHRLSQVTNFSYQLISPISGSNLLVNLGSPVKGFAIPQINQIDI